MLAVPVLVTPNFNCATEVRFGFPTFTTLPPALPEAHMEGRGDPSCRIVISVQLAEHPGAHVLGGRLSIGKLNSQ